MCLKLERDGSKVTFEKCSRCQRRHYCSQKCQKTDWALHRRECISAAEGRQPSEEPAIPSMAVKGTDRSAMLNRRDSQPEVGEKVVIHSLVAKPELNGRLGPISGPLNAGGRYPVKIVGHAATIGVKPTNFHRLAVSVVERQKKARKFECFEHGSEVCSDCSVDFSIANQLSKLCFTGVVLSRDTVERYADTHFASIEHPEIDFMSKSDAEFPFECQGLQSTEKRFLLKALLKSKDESLLVIAAISGMACFGGRSLSATRPSTIPHLEALLTVLKD